MTIDDTPDPAKIMRLAKQALTSAEYRKKFHAADFFGPQEFYEPQLKFFAEGKTHHQRLLRGGNQVGKSFSAAFEASLHMTGRYPRWWPGKKFNKATRGWVVGVTAQLVRDGPQRQLVSRQGEFGSGTIPLASFAAKPVMVPGGTGSIDTLSVAHHTDGVRDGVSTATFKSFEQGATKMQSESVDWIWIDERCPEDVYSELLARTTATDGILFMSYTPLKGGGELTYRFLNEYSADRSDTRIEAHQAKHISAERRAQLEEMCHGLRIPVAWPHDGLQHEKGSGQQLAEIYKRLGAPMLPSHAENHGGGFHTEPAIAEMCSFMKLGNFTIANHITDLTEEILSYHRDEDYKIVRQRDDLISAARYAFMMRRKGKVRDECEGYGRAPGLGGYSAARTAGPKIAHGVDFNVFTGQ
jgi:phage terminase large subunit-like protein